MYSDSRQNKVREGFKEKNLVKSLVIHQTGGEGHHEPNSIFEKREVFFQGPHRTILGHPKHVLHLVLSFNAIEKVAAAGFLLGPDKH